MTAVRQRASDPEGVADSTLFDVLDEWTTNPNPIGEGVMQARNEIYEANTMREPLHDGDLLFVDNIRTARSREPFEGQREVLVAVADAMCLSDVSPTVEVLSNR